MPLFIIPPDGFLIRQMVYAMMKVLIPGGNTLKIQESAENYLESILILKKRNQEVRSIDIVNELGYSKPSVSVAMKHLREDGFIQMDPKGYIELTEKGNQVASKVYERHTLITAALIDIGVSEETAREDACRVEHHISEETFQRLKEHYLKMK